jgi:Gas vesicle synthesis protein GvpL/GvpF
MIYLYAITDPMSSTPRIRGLDDAPLEALEQGALAGVYTTHEQLEFAPEPSLLWRHDEVIEQLMQTSGVLPLRFGTMLDDVDQLRDILVREQPRFARLLDRVRGCVELAVRVGLPPAAETSARNGAEYMEGKLAAQQEREGAARRVLAPLRELANATSPRKSRNDRTSVSESYLVAKDSLEPFVAQVKRLQAGNDGLAVSCTGPWGPYSFVDEVEQ